MEEFAKLADELIAELTTAAAGGAFTPFTFVPKVLWANREIKLKETGILRVDLAPIGFEQSIESRGSWAFDCHYDLGVRKLFAKDQQDADTGLPLDEEVKKLVKLTTDLLARYLPASPGDEGLRFAGLPEAVWVPEKGEQNPVTIDWDHLLKAHQFTGWFPLTYQITRDV